jgi:hypothetical protein
LAIISAVKGLPAKLFPFLYSLLALLVELSFEGLFLSLLCLQVIHHQPILVYISKVTSYRTGGPA